MGSLKRTVKYELGATLAVGLLMSGAAGKTVMKHGAVRESVLGSKGDMNAAGPMAELIHSIGPSRPGESHTEGQAKSLTSTLEAVPPDWGAAGLVTSANTPVCVMMSPGTGVCAQKVDWKTTAGSKKRVPSPPGGGFRLMGRPAILQLCSPTTTGETESARKPL
jgi:hypothetical protein